MSDQQSYEPPAKLQKFPSVVRALNDPQIEAELWLAINQGLISRTTNDAFKCSLSGK
jgi:hypothetical protein